MADTANLVGFSLQRGEEVKEGFRQLVLSGGRPVIEGSTTLEELVTADLVPTRKVDFNGVTYYFSKFFRSKEETEEARFGLDSMVFYVVAPDAAGKKRIFARAAYRNTSENDWRVILHSTRSGVQKLHKEWYGKAFAESGTCLPLEFMDLIDGEFVKEYRGLKVRCTKGKEYVDSKLFLGICAPQEGQEMPNLRVYNGGTMILLGGPEEVLMKEFAKKDPEQRTAAQASLPEQIGWFESDTPESFVFADGFKPDLDKLVRKTETKSTPLYGKVTRYYFLSENEELWYCFQLDNHTGHGWISAAQVTSPQVTGYGIKDVHLKFGEVSAKRGKYEIRMGLFTGAYENSDHIIRGFALGTCDRDIDYADAGTKFTGRIPVIAEFLQRVEDKSLEVMQITAPKKVFDMRSVIGSIRAREELMRKGFSSYNIKNMGRGMWQYFQEVGMPINTPEYVAGLANKIVRLGRVSDQQKAEKAAYSIARRVCMKAEKLA